LFQEAALTGEPLRRVCSHYKIPPPATSRMNPATIAMAHIGIFRRSLEIV
jgi:hypothetical protein